MEKTEIHEKAPNAPEEKLKRTEPAAGESQAQGEALQSQQQAKRPAANSQQPASKAAAGPGTANPAGGEQPPSVKATKDANGTITIGHYIIGKCFFSKNLDLKVLITFSSFKS